jgi:hypothetical protein
MSVKVAYSNLEAVADVIPDIKNKIGIIDAKLVIFFASSKFDIEKVGKNLEKEFPQSKVIGCSTSGEIISGHMLKNSLVVEVMDSAAISDVSISVIDKIKEQDNVEKSLKVFEKYFGQPVSQMDIAKYVGIILFDGLSGAEEKIMDKLGNLTDLVFVGGSAGDDLKFQKTLVFANGKAQNDTAVLALIQPRNGYEIIKTQSFSQTSQTLKADEVDEAARTVIKFNGTGAVEAYAKAVGVAAGKAADKFMSNPLGLMVNGEPFVRSPQQIKDGKMVFYCNIKKGAELAVLESKDIISDTRKEIEKVKNAQGIINFNCILRTLELEAKKQTADYGKIFSKVPTIGFSTYGEAYLGHLNQTATMLVIK